MMVIADDDPATALRISSVARTLNPTFRIVVRTRYIAEIDPLTKAGVDCVIAEELESIIQLFAEVLRDYQIPAEEIEAHEEAVRRSGYQALLSESAGAKPSVECDVTRDCLETRTVIVRAGMPVTTRSLAELDLEAKYGLALKSIRRDGKDVDSSNGNMVLRDGDVLVLSGTASAFSESAALFRNSWSPHRPKAGQPRPSSSTSQADFVDTERVIELSINGNASKCSHLDQIHPVSPSARGCEECLKLGDTWVHLRICMTCGHVGCCDTSKNKHATKHFSQNAHPIIKSLQPGENWAWCYPDNLFL
jgi:CPA2 family monovalent cation:H+ antiporter-2